MNDQATATGTYARLATYLEVDPDNLALIADAAQAAFEEDRFDEADALLARHARLAGLPAHLMHLSGLVSMRRQDWGGAAERFESLMAEGADAPPIRFNRAWSLAMAKRFEDALPLLDEATSAALPQAASLEVSLLHEKGEMEQAAARAHALIALHPDDRGLNAAVSTLAIDLEDVDLAARTAAKAGDHPEALATLGTLALAQDDPAAAEQMFDDALARDPRSPRALIGRGLTRMLVGDKAQAADEIDRGAEMFGTHIGSWVAAGWAHLIAGNLPLAKARFETALALDDSFAESQGSVAVIALLEGNLEEAKRRTEIAMRLDRRNFAGALVSVLLAAGAGDKETARRIFETAINTPIDDRGRTVAQAIARLGTRLG